jgi:phospholipase C
MLPIAIALATPLLFHVASCGSKHSDATTPTDVDGGATTDGGMPVDFPGVDAGLSGPVVPNGIKHIVVILKENRTFENYFTGFPGADTSTQATLSTGQTITRPPAPDAGPTTCMWDHSYNHAVDAYDKGKMDHFDVGVYACPGGDNRPFWVFAESQIPNYWQYARNFAISDRFFSSVNAESTPGHIAIISAQSPVYENPNGCLTPIECGCIAAQSATVATFNPETCAKSTAYPCFDIPSIVDALPAGYTWMSYGQGKGSASESTFNFVKSIGTDANARASHYRDLDQFTSDMGTSAQANLVYAFVGPSPISEGPPDDPCAGETYTVNAVNKIMQSSLWNDSIVIVTWDDWGGNYDHVVPPVEACANGVFFYGGFRLPILLISPFAKKGMVAHTPTEQASIPKLVEELWGMPRMNARDPHARDAKVGSLLEAFDFTQAPAAPLVLTPRTCP